MTEIELNDKNLIEFFIKFSKKPAFFINTLNNEKILRRYDIQKDIVDNIAKLNSKRDLHKQLDLLKELWKNLIALSIIFLKSQDSREEYHDDGDYGLKDLNDFFLKYSDFESLLYGNSIYYRDHLSHMFKVMFLGFFLVYQELDIDGTSGNGTFNNLNFGDDNLKINSISEAERQTMWILIALTHDLGYPIEKFPQMYKKIRNMNEQFNFESVSFNLSQ